MKYSLPICALVSAFSCQSVLSQNKLEEVVVVASLNPTPIREVGAAVSVITEDELSLSAYSSLVDVLRSQVGISAANTGGLGKVSSVSVRGEQGYRTLVLIDGVEISDPSAPQVGPLMEHLSNTNDINRIEMLRGPQGFIYGADAGGIINITTKSASEGMQGEIGTEYGRYDTFNQNVFISLGNETVQGNLSGNVLSSDGFNAVEADVENESDGYENQTLHSKFQVNVIEGLTVKAVVRDVQTEGYFDNCGFPGFENNCEQEFDQRTARIEVQYDQESLNHSISFAKTDVERVSISPTSIFGTEGDLSKSQWLTHWDVNSNIGLSFGAESRNERVRPQGSSDNERDRLAAFTELQTRFFERLYLSAGARFDSDDDFGEHTSGRISAAYLRDISENVVLKFRSSIGNGFRAPSLSEIAYNAGPFAFGEAANTVLQEEKSRGADLGLDLYFGQHSVSMTLFKQLIDEEIFFDNVGFSGYLQEDGETESVGLELDSSFSLSSLWSIKANLTLNETKDFDGDQRARKPEQVANIGTYLTLFGERLSSRLNLRAVSGNIDTNDQDLDDYHLVDFSTKWQIVESFSISLRGENILNKDYVEVNGFNTAGASYYLGASLEF